MTAASHAPQPTYTAEDALTYLFHHVRSTIEWTTDSICCNVSEREGENIETELDQLHGLIETAAQMHGAHGHLNVYSDGRPVHTGARLDDGAVFSHLWHPDPAHDIPRSVDITSQNGVRERIHMLPPSTVTIETITSLTAVPD